MTTSPALEWLDADFEQVLQRYAGDFRYAPVTGNGTARSCPADDRAPVASWTPGQPMRVIPGDYDDPDGGGYDHHHTPTTTRCSASNPTPPPRRSRRPTASWPSNTTRT